MFKRLRKDVEAVSALTHPSLRSDRTWGNPEELRDGVPTAAVFWGAAAENPGLGELGWPCYRLGGGRFPESFLRLGFWILDHLIQAELARYS